MPSRHRARVRAKRALMALGLAAGIAVVIWTPPVSNAWLVLTEPAYVIPAESSLWCFTPTKMNDGSGDWWIYGQDAHNYYHYTGIGEPPYLVLPKADAAKCVGFENTDHRTWCR